MTQYQKARRSLTAILTILLLAWVGYEQPQAATGTLLPAPWQVAADINNNPISGAKACFYIAGTSTPITTYSDVGLTAANTNPVTADSAGRYGPVYLSPGASVKLILQDATGTPGVCNGAVVRTQDNITAVPGTAAGVDVTGIAGETLAFGSAVYLSDGSGGKTAGQWFKTDTANAYSSVTPTVGILPAAITIGQSGTIRVGGSVTSLSSLTIGGNYYIGGAGGLSLVVPTTNARIIGQADTTSSMVVGAREGSPLIQTTALTGTQNNFALTPNVRVLICTNATLTTFTGFTSGYDGQLLTVRTTGAGQVDFVHGSGSSSIGNRFSNFATVGNTSLAAGSGVLTYQYSATSTAWILINHEQGAWITPTFAAGNFTGNGALTWTVTGPQLTTGKYRLDGRTLSVMFLFTNTTTGGVANTNLSIANAAYGGYTAVSAAYVKLGFANDGAVDDAHALLGATTITLAKASGANWALSGVASFSFEHTFEVQ